MQRRKRLGAVVVVLALFVPLACGSKDGEGPPPTIGDATNLERPPDSVPAAGTP